MGSSYTFPFRFIPPASHQLFRIKHYTTQVLVRFPIFYVTSPGLYFTLFVQIIVRKIDNLDWASGVHRLQCLQLLYLAG